MVLTLVMLPAFALADTAPPTSAAPTPTVEPTIQPTVEPTVQPSPSPTAEPTAEPTPEATPQPTVKPSGKDYKVEYKGGNTFATNNSAVPTSVEIDGTPVSFIGDGKSFTVSCIKADSQRITVRWQSTSITANFKPDANITCNAITPPKTGDMSLASSAMIILAAVGAIAWAGKKEK